MAFCQINQDILNLKKPKVRKKKSKSRKKEKQQTIKKEKIFRYLWY